MLRSTLLDYSDAHILVIAVNNTADADTNANNVGKKVICSIY